MCAIVAEIEGGTAKALAVMRATVLRAASPADFFDFIVVLPGAASDLRAV